MAWLRNIHTVLISFIHKHIFTQRFTLRWFLAVHHLELFSLDLSSKSKKSTISYEHSVCPLLLSFCLCIDPPPPSNTNHHRRRETEILNSPVLYSNLRSSQSSHSLSLSLSPPCGIITEKKKKRKKRDDTRHSGVMDLWTPSLTCLFSVSPISLRHYSYYTFPLLHVFVHGLHQFLLYLSTRRGFVLEIGEHSPEKFVRTNDETCNCTKEEEGKEGKDYFKLKLPRLSRYFHTISPFFYY